MIFPSLTLETVVQVEDKLRLNASNSFISGDSGESITDVLIQPEASEAFISVFNTDKDKWSLDWAYANSGLKAVLVRIETDVTPAGRTRSYQIDSLTAEEDILFSTDADLFPLEPRLMDRLPKGKNSFLYAARKAQDRIIAYLDEQRIWKANNSLYTKQDIALLATTEPIVAEQFNFWSTYETLLIIFESLEVSRDDIFQEKKEEYEKMRDRARNRGALRLDPNNSGKIDNIPYDIVTFPMRRR